MIWSLIQQIGGQGASLVVFAILVTVLGPYEIGLVATATTWINILSAFTEMGLGAAIVQRSDIQPSHRSTTFGMNVVVGALLTGIGVLLSWPAALFFRSPEVQPVMAVLSVNFLIRAFGVTQSAVAQRELNFRALATRDLVATIASGALGIAMAVSGYGVWSLVVMTIFGAFINVALLWSLTSWRPRYSEMSITAAKDLLPYSSRMLGFNLFKGVVQNVDRLVIGHLLGPSALGVYTFAYRLLFTPVKALIAATDLYVFPRAARLGADLPAVRDVYLRLNQAALSAVIPGMVVASLLAPVLIPPVFGQQWEPAARIIPILAIGVVLQAMFSPVGQLMKALGRPGWLLLWSVFFSGLIVLVMWVGTSRGLVGGTVGFVVAHMLGFPGVLWILNRLVGIRFAEFLRRLVPLFAAGAAMGITVFVVLAITPGPAWFRSLVATTTAIAAYIRLLVWLEPALVDMLRERLGVPFRKAAT